MEIRPQQLRRRTVGRLPQVLLLLRLLFHDQTACDLDGVRGHELLALECWLLLLLEWWCSGPGVAGDGCTGHWGCCGCWN